MVAETAEFTRRLPVRSEFLTVLQDAEYQRVPDHWLIAVSDVVGSRKAIAAGQYKAVNMAGVALISALMNALDTQAVPYIFGGDGSAIICAPDDEAIVAETMAKTSAWVRDELGLDLRVALIPVVTVREAGYDLLVQATRVSEAISNYAFRGGGLSHAERLMKEGKFAVTPGPPGSRPDLTGLSCRWSPISSEGEKIVSIIIEAGEAGVDQFPHMAQRMLDFVLMPGRSASPVTDAKLGFRWPPATLDLEARASRGASSLLAQKLRLMLQTLLAWVLFKTGMRAGGFDPKRYKEFTSRNTDYRKFQDGLRVTVSLDDARLARLTEFLERERESRVLRYGLCVQDSAILTCYVPSVMSDAHFHFLDGAGGGYAQAAENMKS